MNRTLLHYVTHYITVIALSVVLGMLTGRFTGGLGTLVALAAGSIGVRVYIGFFDFTKRSQFVLLMVSAFFFSIGIALGLIALHSNL